MAALDESLQWLTTQHDAMCRLVHDWANINSGSCHFAGLTTMAMAIQESFAGLGCQFQAIKVKPFHEMNNKGQWQDYPIHDVLSFRKRPEAPLQILLTGHMDTVFGIDHKFQTAKQMEDNILNGPGVTDMKGGIIVMLYALLALEQSSVADKIGWEVLINPDEELGSPSSAPVLVERAQNHHLALVYEPALNRQGDVASERKGSGKFTLVVRGRAAHAGRAFHDGRNAITLMAKCLTHIDALNGQRDDLTINIGTIIGGDAVNIVPELCITHIDVRTKQHSDEAWVKQKFEAIIHELNQNDGFSIECHGGFTREPKPFTGKIKTLFELIAETAEELGQKIQAKPVGGCCDGNNLAAVGLPVIDSMGVCGENIHSDQEIIYLDSLVPRAQLSALLFMKLATGAGEQFL